MDFRKRFFTLVLREDTDELMRMIRVCELKIPNYSTEWRLDLLGALHIS